MLYIYKKILIFSFLFGVFSDQLMAREEDFKMYLGPQCPLRCPYSIITNNNNWITTYPSVNKGKPIIQAKIDSNDPPQVISLCNISMPRSIAKHNGFLNCEYFQWKSVIQNNLPVQWNCKVYPDGQVPYDPCAFLSITIKGNSIFDVYLPQGQCLSTPPIASDSGVEFYCKTQTASGSCKFLTQLSSNEYSKWDAEYVIANVFGNKKACSALTDSHKKK